MTGDADRMEENSFGQKLLAEVIGTGFLVFIGVGSVPATLLLNGNGSTHPFTMADLGIISFAFALIVIAMVYALGHISGCHINPAVTVALAVTKKFPWNKVPAYIAAQLIGATLGAAAFPMPVIAQTKPFAGQSARPHESSGRCRSFRLPSPHQSRKGRLRGRRSPAAAAEGHRWPRAFAFQNASPLV